MRVVIDTNILISALINPAGKEADILLNPLYEYEKYSCYFLFVEILKHKDKLLKFSSYKEVDFLELYYCILRKLKFINEEHIPFRIWEQALFITKDIDENDTPFVALTIYLDGILWSGDKKIMKCLEKKDFNKYITTKDLIVLLEKR